MKTGPKFYHKQDHGGSTHNGPIKLYPEGPVFVVAMTYTKLSIFQYEIVCVPALREYFGTQLIIPGWVDRAMIIFSDRHKSHLLEPPT